MSKKGENIFFRKDGRWEARYAKGYDENNKIIYGYVYGNSYSEVKKKRNIILLSLKIERKNIDNNIFSSSIDSFLKQKKIEVKQSTIARYYEIINAYINPYFSKIKISDLNSDLILDICNKYFCKLSPKTLKDILILLNQIIRYSNLDIKISYPKVYNYDVDIISNEEILKIENYIFNNLNNITCGILLSLYMGIRIGELCALKFSDIDLINKTININKTLLRIKNINALDEEKRTKIIINSPKSNNSKRLIPIPSIIIPSLKVIIENKKCDDDYFLSNSSKYIEPRLLRYKFKNIMKSLGSESKFHALRHTFATRCIELGFDPKTLSQILGHANVKTTLTLYVHPNYNYKIMNMEKLRLLSSQEK